MRYFKLFTVFLNRSLQHLIEYKANFIIWSLVTGSWTIISIFFFEMLYGYIDSLAGWTKPMMYVFQGSYFIINFVIWGLIWENIETLPRKINRGELDLLLVKPVNSQFIVSFQVIDPSNVTDLCLGLTAIIYGLHQGGITPSLLQILTFIILLVVAAIFFYSAWFITVCFAFWSDRLDNIPHLFPGLRQIWRFPRSVYAGVPYFILSYLLPVSLAATIPPQILLGIFEPLSIILLITFSGVALWLSHFFYQFSLRHYSSASS